MPSGNRLNVSVRSNREKALKLSVIAVASLALSACAPSVEKEPEAKSETPAAMATPTSVPHAQPPGVTPSGQTTGTAPASSGTAATPETSSPAAAKAASDQASTMSIEWHAQPAPAGYKLPWPDALPALDIEPGKRGGTFTFVFFGEGPKTFDPITNNESSSGDVIGMMYDSLIRYNFEKQQYIPGMLKEWYMEADKSIWTLKMRSGMKWSDGQPITADDFMFSIQVLYDPNIINAAKDILKVDGKPIQFEKVDDLTIRAKLAKPSGSFHVMVASIPIVPKHTLEAAYKAGKYDTALNINVDPAKMVCNGPYKLKTYQSGQRVILERNPQYYVYDQNGTQLPYMDQVVFNYVPDMDATYLRFKGGESDVLTAPRPEFVADLRDGQKAGNYTLRDLGPGEGGSFLWLNLKQGNNPKTGKPYVEPNKQKLFANETFRKAVYHAMNKDAIINSVLRGLSVSIWGHDSPALTFWYDPNIKKYPYDLPKAKQMLESIGLKDRDGDGIREDEQGNKVGFTFISNKGNKVREEASSLLAADLKAAGINAVPQFMDFNALVTKINDTYEYEGCYLGFGGSIHPSTSMNLWKSSGRTHFTNPLQEKPATEWEAEIDKLCDQFTTTLDLQEQRKVYWKMQEIYADHCGSFPLWTSKFFVALRNSFGNAKLSSLSSLGITNLDEMYRK